jgi:hypothetical protein
LKLGENFIQMLVDSSVYAAKYVTCKNIYALFLWILSTTDRSLQRLTNAFTFYSLQTMPAVVMMGRYESLLQKYYYLTDIFYRQLLTNLFTGVVFGGTVKAIHTLMEGFLPSVLTDMSLIKGAINIDYLIKNGQNINYDEINFEKEIVVKKDTTYYVINQDLVIRADDSGYAYIKWLDTGNSPSLGDVYDAIVYLQSYEILFGNGHSKEWWVLQEHRMLEWTNKTEEGYVYITDSGIWKEQNKMHFFLKPDPSGPNVSYALQDRMYWITLLSKYMYISGLIIKWFDFKLYWYKQVRYKSPSPFTYYIGLPLILDINVESVGYPLLYYYVNGVSNDINNFTIDKEGNLTVNDSLPDNTILHLEFYFLPMELITLCQQLVKQQHVKVVNLFYDSDRNPITISGV